MSRFHRSSSYGQRIQRLGNDHYRISWVVDRYYSSSRLRFPTGFSRDTDEKGALRFAKRHEVQMPPSRDEPGQNPIGAGAKQYTCGS